MECLFLTWRSLRCDWSRQCGAVSGWASPSPPSALEKSIFEHYMTDKLWDGHDLSEYDPRLKPHLGVATLLIVLEHGHAELEARQGHGTAPCRCISPHSGAPHSHSVAPPPWRWRSRRPGPSWQPPLRCQTFPCTRSTKILRRMTGILSAPRVCCSFAPWPLSVRSWGHVCILLDAWHVPPSPLTVRVVSFFRS